MGLSRVSDALTKFLLPNIITTTDRARYYSFYTWVIADIEKQREDKKAKRISFVEEGGLGEASRNTTPNRILALIQSDPRISQQELAAKLGITRDGVKYHLKKLREKGRLSHTGPTRGGVWEVIRQHQR